MYRTNRTDASTRRRTHQTHRPNPRHDVSILAYQDPRKHRHLWTRTMVQIILDGQVDRKGFQRQGWREYVFLKLEEAPGRG